MVVGRTGLSKIRTESNLRTHGLYICAVINQNHCIGCVLLPGEFVEDISQLMLCYRHILFNNRSGPIVECPFHCIFNLLHV